MVISGSLRNPHIIELYGSDFYACMYVCMCIYVQPYDQLGLRFYILASNAPGAPTNPSFCLVLLLHRVVTMLCVMNLYVLTPHHALHGFCSLKEESDLCTLQLSMVINMAYFVTSTVYA